jgi:probable HAF family extracellular repeat protein
MIDFPGASDNRARGINDGGEIVGRFDNADGTYHGYLRSSEGDFASLDVPGALQTEAYRINDAGDVVGVYVSADGTTHGFLMKQ